MTRPDFPRPYIMLPASCIRRIVEEQNYYDRDPERAEREQRAREERRLEEERELAECLYYEEQNQEQLLEEEE